MSLSTPTDIFSTVFSIFMVIAGLCTPFLVGRALLKKQSVLDQAWYKNTIGTLYSQIKTSSRPALMYNVFFITRRIAFSASALLLGNYPFFQIQLLMLQSIVMIQYLFLIRPFMNRVLNATEIFNEICIMIASYHLFMFTDFQPNSEIKYSAGWSLVAISSLNMMVNIFVMVGSTLHKILQALKALRRKIKLWVHKRVQSKQSQVKQKSKLDTYLDPIPEEEYEQSMQPDYERSPLKPQEASGRKKKRKPKRFVTLADKKPSKTKNTFGSPVKKLQTDRNNDEEDIKVRTPLKIKDIVPALKSLKKRSKVRKAPMKTQDTSKDLDQSRRELLDTNKNADNLDDYIAVNEHKRAIEPSPRTRPPHYPMEAVDQVIKFVANDHLIIIQPLASKQQQPKPVQQQQNSLLADPRKDIIEFNNLKSYQDIAMEHFDSGASFVNIGRTKKERYDNEVEDSLQRQVVMNNRDINRFMQVQSLNSNVENSVILKHPMLVNFRSQQQSIIKEEMRRREEKKRAFGIEDKSQQMRY